MEARTGAGFVVVKMVADRSSGQTASMVSCSTGFRDGRPGEVFGECSGCRVQAAVRVYMVIRLGLMSG